MTSDTQDAGPGARACAQAILATIPRVMRVLRREMRRQTRDQLSVPQFRVLVFLGRNQGASLSDVAEELGVAKATASVMVDRLVRRGLVTRESHPTERRRVTLCHTPAGSELLNHARRGARDHVAGCLASLSETELSELAQSLERLGAALLSEDGRCAGTAGESVSKTHGG